MEFKDLRCLSTELKFLERLLSYCFVASYSFLRSRRTSLMFWSCLSCSKPSCGLGECSSFASTLYTEENPGCWTETNDGKSRSSSNFESSTFFEVVYFF